MKSQKWLFEKENSVRLMIKVKANAPKNALKGVRENRLEVSLSAIREKGRANAALISFLADCLATAKSNIKILKGETLPLKEVAIYNVAYTICYDRLAIHEALK
jgi:uncharacterized protein YggU (UPF0235/DUF167 family)